MLLGVSCYSLISDPGLFCEAKPRQTLYRFAPLPLPSREKCKYLQPDLPCNSFSGDSKVIEMIFRDAKGNLDSVFKLQIKLHATIFPPLRETFARLNPFTCESADQFLASPPFVRHRRVMHKFWASSSRLFGQQNCIRTNTIPLCNFHHSE